MENKKQYKVAIIPCDGIGKDVSRGAKIVLDVVNESTQGFSLDFLYLDAGQSAL